MQRTGPGNTPLASPAGHAVSVSVSKLSPHKWGNRSWRLFPPCIPSLYVLNGNGCGTWSMMLGKLVVSLTDAPGPCQCGSMRSEKEQDNSTKPAPGISQGHSPPSPRGYVLYVPASARSSTTPTPLKGPLQLYIMRVIRWEVRSYRP